MSATRMSTRRRAAALLAATAAAAAGAAVVLSGASAQEPATRTLHVRELDKGATFVHVRNTRPKSRQSNALGDLIVFTNPVTDESGARIGTVHVQCVTTAGARHFSKSTISCQAIMHLRDGDLTAQFIGRPGDDSSTGAITGGTGAYANARGVFVSEHDKNGRNDTITLTG